MWTVTSNVSYTFTNVSTSMYYITEPNNTWYQMGQRPTTIRPIVFPEAQLEESKQRALELLLSLLNDAQRKEWAERDQVTIVGSEGGRYILRRGWTGNVIHCHPDGTNHGYCRHTRTDVPVEDNVAAQILELRANESAFLAGANRW